MAVRKIFLLTGNINKAKEYKVFFGHYGIKPVIKIPGKEINTTIKECIEDGADIIVIEQSNLYAPGSDKPITDYVHMSSVINRSHAYVYTIVDQKINSFELTEEVEGYINLEAQSSGEVFGWDDIFIPLKTGLSYNEALKLGLKISARDFILSRIIKDFFLFEKPVDLKFNPLKITRAVDFTSSPASHLKNETWFQTTAFKSSPLASLLGSSLQNGVFFRSSESRRERNYWLPGLNGGIPLVPKKDEIHEITFQFHDIMHAVMPDLIYDGTDTELGRRIYIIHRMIGEAISLVAADAMFVDTLSKSGCKYDFSKRKIYPLFKELNLDLQTTEGFYTAALANTKYALLGDDSKFLELGASVENLNNYKAKYESYFVQDYRWTSENFSRMVVQKELFSRWSQKLSGIMKEASVYSLKGFIEELELKDLSMESLVEVVFNHCWSSFFLKSLQNGLTLDSDNFDYKKATSRGFLRYMMGQLVMYERYSHISSISVMGNILRNELISKVDKNEIFDIEDIKRIRKFHEMAVEYMEKISVISPEDARIFKEVVPVFEPFFVFYEGDKTGTQHNIISIVNHLMPDLKEE